jgi:hypothetical protein
LLKLFGVVLSVSLVPASVLSQQGVPEAFLQDNIVIGDGWRGFTDLGFLFDALLNLMLATVLGGVLAYHPKLLQTADTLEEIEARKVYVFYSVVGALIGILVVKYGLVVGFVLFGIGGLIRFRTVLRSAVMTGQVIFITLIGLSCGLNLPHVAVLATAFGFALIYVLDAHITYQIDVRALPPDRFAAAATAYRGALEQVGCKILSEKKNPGKQRLAFICRTHGHVARGAIEDALDTAIDPSLKGSVDWELS